MGPLINFDLTDYNNHRVTRNHTLVFYKIKMNPIKKSLIVDGGKLKRKVREVCAY